MTNAARGEREAVFLGAQGRSLSVFGLSIGGRDVRLLQIGLSSEGVAC